MPCKCMGAVIAFGVSLGALVLFLSFKLWEQSHDMPTYTSVRRRGDTAVTTTLRKVRRYALRLEEELSASRVARRVVHYTARVVARVAQYVEAKAHAISRNVARSTAQGHPTRSSFLREVSTHKRSLDTQRLKRDTKI